VTSVNIICRTENSNFILCLNLSVSQTEFNKSVSLFVIAGISRHSAGCRKETAHLAISWWRIFSIWRKETL